MTFDDLPLAWQKENAQLLSPEDREATITRVCRRVERVEGAVIRRDLMETVAAVIVMFLFAGAVVSVNSVVSKIGAGLVVLWSLFIIWKLYRTRTIQQPAPLDASVREFCRIEQNRLECQIRLLRSVLWWYIGPLLLGVNMVFIGEAGLGNASLMYGIVTVLFAWGIYALNMRAVAKELVPSRDELAKLMCQLEDH